MRSESEIRERFEDVKGVIKILNELGVSDKAFIAFHTVLEWILEDSDKSILEWRLQPSGGTQ